MSEWKTILGVVLFSVVALAAAILIPSTEPPAPDELPWRIEPTADGSITVFGITLGRTTLAEVERRLRQEAKVNLFIRTGDGGGERPVVEAFFDRVELAGLGAQMVVTFDLPEAELLAMFERGERIAKVGSGDRKVILAAEDLAQIYRLPVTTLTYLPKINLSQEVAAQRFGEPAERLREPKGGAVHWLYPARGLDLLLSEEEKEVLQYMPPRDFERLLQPLRELVQAGAE